MLMKFENATKIGDFTSGTDNTLIKHTNKCSYHAVIHQITMPYAVSISNF